MRSARVYILLIWRAIKILKIIFIAVLGIERSFFPLQGIFISMRSVYFQYFVRATRFRDIC